MSQASILISKGLRDIAKELDEKIEDIAGERVSFSLFIWMDGRCNYISSSSGRKEIKAALLAVINGWDDGMPDIPAHKIT